MNAMKRAHQIRSEAAEKWNCKVSEIIFSLCLEMAWAETKKENEMNGSEKQIAWAEDIKAKALKEITEEAAAEYAAEEDEELDMEMFKAYRTKLETCNDARWFIDHARRDAEEIFYWMEIVDEETTEDAKEALGI